MPSSDRAFRALARAQPGVIAELLRALVPGSIPDGAALTPHHVEDSRLDASSYLEDADWLVRVGDEDLDHVECQGYRDSTFPDRVFRYHIGAVLRYPRRRVRTFALWLIEPPPSQAIDVIERGSVRVIIHAIVLPRASAEILLADPLTACFAPGAHLGALSVEELCRRVARILRESGATHYQRWMAVVVATMRGRYTAMVLAMKMESMEPFVIEDLVKFGEDRGYDRGYEQGFDRGRAAGLELLRGALLDVLGARAIPVGADELARIAIEASPEQLREWSRRAATATSAGQVFLD